MVRLRKPGLHYGREQPRMDNAVMHKDFSEIPPECVNEFPSLQIRCLFDVYSNGNRIPEVTSIPQGLE